MLSPVDLVGNAVYVIISLDGFSGAFPRLENGDKYCHHQHQDLKGTKPEIHLLVVEIGGVVKRGNPEFSRYLHHGGFPGTQKKGAKHNGSQGYNPLESEPVVLEKAPVGEE